MPPKDDEVSLIMSSHDLFAMKLWLFRQKIPEKLGGLHPQCRRKVVQNQLRGMRHRIFMVTDVLTSLALDTRNRQEGPEGRCSIRVIASIFLRAFSSLITRMSVSPRSATPEASFSRVR